MVNILINDDIEESRFDRNPSFAQKWATKEQLEHAVKSDSLIDSDVMLGPEPLQLLIQSLNKTTFPLEMFIPFSQPLNQTNQTSSNTNLYVSQTKKSKQKKFKK